MSGATPLLILYADVARVRGVKLQGTSDVLFFIHIFRRIWLFGIKVNASADAGPRKRFNYRLSMFVVYRHLNFENQWS